MGLFKRNFLKHRGQLQVTIKQLRELALELEKEEIARGEFERVFNVDIENGKGIIWKLI